MGHSSASSATLPTQISLRTEVILKEQTDQPYELGLLVERVERGLIVHPPHQRDFVWTEEKKRAWIARITVPREKAVGCIVTYQIADGHDSPVYVNDGWQRLCATREFKADPTKYGISREDADIILSSYSITVQHRHYPSHVEALRDFQGLNLGTSLTPYEFYRGVFTNMPNYEALWRPIIDELHDAMQHNARLCNKPKAIQTHQLYRHDYALLHRFLADTSDLVSYERLASLDVRPSLSPKVVERRLCDLLLTMDPSDVSKQCRRLLQIVSEETALFEEVYTSTDDLHGKVMSHTLYRWLLDIAVWRRASQIPVARWETFVRRLIVWSEGTPSVRDYADEKRRMTIGLGQASNLRKVCAFIGSDLWEELPKRPPRSPLIRSGYDVSHVQPFSTHGNGATVPEPASLNRARGAKPMEGEL